jgi:hypothetical protein
MSEITERIRTAGFWEVAIHPTTFRERRVGNVAELLPLLQGCVVSVRGWDFPHIDRHLNVTTHLDFIQQESDWEQFTERWRFYQSGQFVILRAMHYDWRDRSSWHPQDAGWRRGAVLGIGDALYTLLEIFELAARISNTAAGDDPMRVAIKVGGLRDRRLVVDDPRRLDIPRADYVAAINELPLEFVHSRAELLADPASFAVEAARQLFARFNRDIPAARLSEWLETLRRGH